MSKKPMKTKLILIAGAPRSGKDTLARLLYPVFQQEGLTSFMFVISDTLKAATHWAYDTPKKNINAYEECKDKPHDDFLGETPRNAYIDHAERYMKPKHGMDVYAQFMVKKIERSIESRKVRNQNNAVYFLPGVGFQEEIDVIIKAFGEKNVLLIKLERAGTDFKLDSRGPVHHIDPSMEVVLVNDKTLAEFEEEALLIARPFISS